jgi:hypothetical protein
VTLPVSTTPWLSQALTQVMGQAAGIKQQAIDGLALLQAGPVDSVWVFNAADVMRNTISNFNRFSGVTGLNAYATAQVPGYAGTMTADIAATVAATQSCLDWIVANFPKDTTATFVLAYILNADGTRTPRTFTTVQTAGLQTRLQALIATIG